MSSLSLSTTTSLIEASEEITPSELSALVIMGEGVSGAAGKVRFKHHRIAQLIAAGMKNVEVAEIVGVTQSNISTLLKSPAMQELVRNYIEQGWAEIEAVTRRARMAASAGVEELHKRIEQRPELITTKDLANATLGLLDRGGVAQRHVVFTGGLSKADILDILDSSKGSGRVLDVSATSDDAREVGGGTVRRAVCELLSGEDAGTEGGASLREASSQAS
jgi:predicted transcriptional regulator